MMAIFLMTSWNKIFGPRESLIPSSCKAVLVMLNKRIPATWSTQCEGKTKNNLFINMHTHIKAADDLTLKKALYRTLANNLVFIAKNSPADSLERVDIVRLKMNHHKIEINAITEGKDIIKFSTMKDPDFIKDHLKLTVQVQEKIK